MAVQFSDPSHAFTRTTGGFPNRLRYSATCWARLDVDQDAWAQIFGWENPSGGDWLLIGTSENGTALAVSGDDTPDGTVHGGDLTVSTWTRLAVTEDGTTTRLYYQPLGAPSPTLATGSSRIGSTATRFDVGNDSFGEWFHGAVAALKIWDDVVLSQSEIEAEWASLAAVRTAGLHAEYRFQAGALALDSSGNGRHLSGGVGSTWVEDPAPLGPAPVTGPATWTLPALAVAGQGAHVPPGASGVATLTLPALGVAAAGAHVPPPALVWPTVLAPWAVPTRRRRPRPLARFLARPRRVAEAVPGVAGLTLPGLGLAAAGTHTPPGAAGAAALTLPSLRLTGAGAHVPPGVAGEAHLVLPGLRVAAQGAPGVAGVAALGLPALGVAAQGTAPVVGEANLRLPGLRVDARSVVNVPGVRGALTVPSPRGEITTP